MVMNIVKLVFAKGVSLDYHTVFVPRTGEVVAVDVSNEIDGNYIVTRVVNYVWEDGGLILSGTTCYLSKLTKKETEGPDESNAAS